MHSLHILPAYAGALAYVTCGTGARDRKKSLLKYRRGVGGGGDCNDDDDDDDDGYQRRGERTANSPSLRIEGACGEVI